MFEKVSLDPFALTPEEREIVLLWRIFSDEVSRGEADCDWDKANGAHLLALQTSEKVAGDKEPASVVQHRTYQAAQAIRKGFDSINPSDFTAGSEDD